MIVLANDRGAEAARVVAAAGALYLVDGCAHVGEQHAGERTGADACEFDDAETGQRAGGAGGGLGGWFVEHLFFLPGIAVTSSVLIG